MPRLLAVVTMAAAGAASLVLGGCADPAAAPAGPYYSAGDFTAVRKFDAHVHANSAGAAFLEQARADGFELLSINTDVPGFPPLDVQESIALTHAAADPGRFHFATTFSMQGWADAGWAGRVHSQLAAAVQRGAVAVKVWKNVGMTVRDANGRLVMVDAPGLDAVFAGVRDLGVPVIGHQGEPRNCWLPLDQMTTRSDRNYFGTHPEYYMYLHPELPSYEEQMAARDRRLDRTAGLVFVGAHLASLEWSVERLAAFLDAHPQACADMARMTQLQYQSQRAREAVRTFCIRYQDRLVYGTDLICDDGTDPAAFRSYAHAVWWSDWRYLATAEEQWVDDIGATVAGLQLPRRVVEKIYWTNAWRTFLAAGTRTPARIQ